jgi:Na+:H+ antiporter, NhaA family
MITSEAGMRGGRIRTVLRALLANEAAGGLVLMAANVLALVVANSPLAPAYFGALKTYVLGLSILHWINDALMAVFFLLVGLEIKREMLDGQLRTWPDRALPGIAALGGMLVPALIYVAVNWQMPETLRGWAIPAATDIAFALGVLSLLGPRAGLAQGVPDRARHPGRPRGRPDHRRFLHGQPLARVPGRHVGYARGARRPQSLRR